MLAKIGDNTAWESRTIKLLGITIDNELKFDELIDNVSMKALRKFTVLMTIRKYLDFNKLRILFKIFLESQYKYCLVTWMVDGRNTNSKINKLQLSVLRIVYDEYTSAFKEKLEKDTVDQYNIQTLCIDSLIYLKLLSLIYLPEITIVII